MLGESSDELYPCHCARVLRFVPFVRLAWAFALLSSWLAAADARSLDLSFNNIRDIPVLPSLTKVHVLYFVQNKISRIDEGSLDWCSETLTSLELGGNRIRVGVVLDSRFVTPLDVSLSAIAAVSLLSPSLSKSQARLQIPFT
jgi:Leucine-rich repeat (LRR) protein